MARPMSADLYPDVRPLSLLAALMPHLRRLRVLFYLSVALLLVAVLGAYLPLGTWLLLCTALAAPTLASFVLVAAD